MSPLLQKLAVLSIVFVCGSLARGADEKLGPDPARVKDAQAKAIQFLKTTQSDDGSWTVSNSPGISGLVSYSLLRSGVGREDAVVGTALKHLETFVQKDGGIYDLKSDHRNYETSIALLALAAANSDGKYTETIAHARDFLKSLQWDEAEGAPRSDVKFGGAGYGKSKRPDLSNTAFLIEALKAAGVKSDDEALQNALVFVSRTQNLESEHNNTEFAAKVNDGGFYYTPASGGNSQAGTVDGGGLRSYASMTYAGLKSMIHAGLKPDDPRVAAAIKWLRKHYSLKENPGMGQQGLYYYYHTFAKALSVMNLPYMEDATGTKHDWRKELAEELIKQQKENGSWINAAPRWMEGDPNMATAYALLALSYCQ